MHVRAQGDICIGLFDAHICPMRCWRPSRSAGQRRALSPEGHLLSLFTQSASRSEGVNLIIRLHKRASFLFNHLANEEREPGFLEARGPGPVQNVQCFDKAVFPVGGQQQRPHCDIPLHFVVYWSTFILKLPLNQAKGIPIRLTGTVHILLHKKEKSTLFFLTLGF